MFIQQIAPVCRKFNLFAFIVLKMCINWMESIRGGCDLLSIHACFHAQLRMLLCWSNARCAYSNASITPIKHTVVSEGQSRHFPPKTNHVLKIKRFTWCIFNRLAWWAVEQPTFYTLIQPSNGDGFGDRAAHAPIDTVLFYTLKRYVCTTYIEGYWIGGVGASGIILAEWTKANQLQSSRCHKKSTCVQ